MANDIKQRIILEGEKEYNSALKQAQRNLKTLRTELKAETAELGNNATAQQKNQARAKNLQKQIQEQEKAVKAHRDALEEVRKKYGDNEEAIAKYEQRLNSARAALADMKNQLDAVDASYDAVTDGAKSSVLETNALAESFKRVGEAATSISSAIEQAFKGIIGTIKDTVSSVWSSVVDLAARSNNLVDLAGFWNTDVKTIQKYKGAVSEVSGTLEDLNSLVTKINYLDSKKVAELTGVSSEGYSDQWEYAMAVMDAMSQMDAEARNAAGFELFGKSATKAFDLLNDWSKLQANLDKYDVDKGGYGLTEEQLQNMSDLYDKVNGLKQSWQDLKDMAVVRLFGNLSMNITGNLQNILDGLRDYFNAGDDQAKKDAAIQKIKDNIKEMFEAIRAAIEAGVKALNELAEEFKKSDDPALQTIGGVLEWIANTIKWLADPENWKKIKDGIEIVLGAWLFLKLASVAGAIGKVVGSLKTIFGFRNAKVPTTTGTTPTTTGTTPTTNPATNPATNQTISQATQTAATAAGAKFLGGGGVASGASSSMYASVQGLSAVAGEAGMGGAVGGMGTLSAVGALGGTAIIAAGVWALGEFVKGVNAKAEKAREVGYDAARFSEIGAGEQGIYEFGGVDRRKAIIDAVNTLEGLTGADAAVGDTLKLLSQNLGGDLLEVFNYTNTSGESRNKLVDMLSMDDQNAAVAAMMLMAAGVDPNTVEYRYAYQKYLDMKRNGSFSYTAGLMTMRNYFQNSGIRDANGNWTIAGYEAGSENTMPVINGVPLANMSGYVMTREENKPKSVNGSLWWGRNDLENEWGLNGTWDPTQHASDWWRNPGASGSGKVDVSDSSISGMKKAFVDGMSNVKVVMDKETVGRLVAEAVSRQIAREIQ